MNVIAWMDQLKRQRKSSTKSELVDWFVGEEVTSTTEISPHDLVDEFEFLPLVKVRKKLKEAKWDEKETNDFIIALSELPEYEKDKNRVIKRSK